MAPNEALITVEIAYANPQKQALIAIKVPSGTTIQAAIAQSDILTQFPEIDLTQNKVGIFNNLAPLSQVVEDGDRIEIYRSLLIDPKSARKKRAQSKSN